MSQKENNKEIEENYRQHEGERRWRGGKTMERRGKKVQGGKGEGEADNDISLMNV